MTLKPGNNCILLYDRIFLQSECILRISKQRAIFLNTYLFVNVLKIIFYYYISIKTFDTQF